MSAARTTEVFHLHSGHYQLTLPMTKPPKGQLPTYTGTHNLETWSPPCTAFKRVGSAEASGEGGTPLGGGSVLRIPSPKWAGRLRAQGMCNSQGCPGQAQHWNPGLDQPLDETSIFQVTLGQWGWRVGRRRHQAEYDCLSQWPLLCTQGSWPPEAEATPPVLNVSCHGSGSFHISNAHSRLPGQPPSHAPSSPAVWRNKSRIWDE